MRMWTRWEKYLTRNNCSCYELEWVCSWLMSSEQQRVTKKSTILAMDFFHELEWHGKIIWHKPIICVTYWIGLLLNDEYEAAQSVKKELWYHECEWQGKMIWHKTIVWVIYTMSVLLTVEHWPAKRSRKKALCYNVLFINVNEKCLTWKKCLC